jgi:hypothetical protein
LESNASAKLTTVHVRSMSAFLANVGQPNRRIVVATRSTDPGGDYVFKACRKGVDERADPTCGMVVLGPGTEVIGEGRNEIVDGVPTGEVLVEGPLFDCGALLCQGTRGGPCTSSDWGPRDYNGWDLGCFELSGGNSLSGVRIDNGPDAVF